MNFVIPEKGNETGNKCFLMDLKLFYEKGYEKTTISDIAKEINVAQGLCYRYFPSKEMLFDCAIDQYAQILADSITEYTKDTELSLKELIMKKKYITKKIVL